jgi:hypothetical protein
MPAPGVPFPGRSSASVPRSLKKVKSGDPLIIPAQTFNAFVDAALDYRFRQQQVSAGDLYSTRQTGIVLVRNDSGADRNRFDVLGISGPIITPTDNADAFKERVALSGVTPGSENEHVGRFVVLLEPVTDGGIGRAVLDGVSVVRVEMVDEDHGFADAKPDSAEVLESASSGSAQLLWVESERERGSNTAWAVARIGLPQGSGSSIRLARLVSFHWTEVGPDQSIADAFYGYFIDAIAQPNPDPIPELTEFWPKRYPIATLSKDMRHVVPGIPFGTTNPGESDTNNGQADVWVHWVKDYRVSEEDGGGRWYLVNDFVGVCIG